MTPTRSIYDFDNGHVHVTLTFTTPALPSNLTTLSQPVTYESWDVHAVDIYTYLNTTSARTPRSDLYQVNDVASSGFTAGSVVGGPFIRLMDDPTTWAKYDTQDTTKLTGSAAADADGHPPHRLVLERHDCHLRGQPDDPRLQPRQLGDRHGRLRHGRHPGST